MMAKIVGMGSKTEKEEGVTLFEKEKKNDRAEIDKLRKEKIKILEENKKLKKELAMWIKPQEEQKETLIQADTLE